MQTADEFLKQIQLQNQSPLDNSGGLNNPNNYTNENNWETLGGATAIGAGKTLSHMFLSAPGGAMHYAGTWFDDTDPLTENDRNILYSLGMTDEEIDLRYPKRDNFLKAMGKGYLEMGAAAGDKLDEWKQDLLGNNPTKEARLFEGAGTSIGHAVGAGLIGFLTGGAAGALAAAAQPFNPIGSMTEAWTEYGGFNDEAYRKGLIDKPGVGATGLKLLAANTAYNFAQDRIGGAISGAIGKGLADLPGKMGNFFQRASNSPWTMAAVHAMQEIPQETTQEPSQEIISEAAWKSIENDTGFLSELGSSVKNDWWDRFKQLAPEVAASTIITSGLMLPFGVRAARSEIDQKLKVEEYNKLADDYKATVEKIKTLDPNNTSAIEAQRLHLANLEATLNNFDKSPEEIEGAKVAEQLQTESNFINGQINKIIQQNNNVIYPNSEAEHSIFDLLNKRNNIENVLDGDDINAAKTMAADLSTERKAKQLAELNTLVGQAQNTELQKLGLIETPQTSAQQPYIAQAPVTPTQQTTFTPNDKQTQNKAPDSTLPNELLQPLYEESTRIMGSILNFSNLSETLTPGSQLYNRFTNEIEKLTNRQQEIDNVIKTGDVKKANRIIEELQQAQAKNAKNPQVQNTEHTQEQTTPEPLPDNLLQQLQSEQIDNANTGNVDEAQALIERINEDNNALDNVDNETTQQHQQDTQLLTPFTTPEAQADNVTRVSKGQDVSLTDLFNNTQPQQNVNADISQSVPAQTQTLTEFNDDTRQALESASDKVFNKLTALRKATNNSYTPDNLARQEQISKLSKLLDNIDDAIESGNVNEANRLLGQVKQLTNEEDESDINNTAALWSNAMHGEGEETYNQSEANQQLSDEVKVQKSLKPREKSVGKFNFRDGDTTNEFQVISTAKNTKDIGRLARYRGRYIEVRDANGNVAATYYPYTGEFTLDDNVKSKHDSQWTQDFEDQFRGDLNDYLKEGNFLDASGTLKADKNEGFRKRWAERTAKEGNWDSFYDDELQPEDFESQEEYEKANTKEARLKAFHDRLIINLMAQQRPYFNLERSETFANYYINGVIKYFSKYSNLDTETLLKADNLQFEYDNDLFQENNKANFSSFGAKYNIHGELIEEARKVITLTDISDISSLIHETGHLFLEKLERLARAGELKALAKQDFETLLKAYEAEGLDFNSTDTKTQALKVEVHERFATDAERYFLTGKTPSSKLKRVFENFKRWLRYVYNSINEIEYVGQDGKQHTQELKPEVAEVFQHILEEYDNNTTTETANIEYKETTDISNQTYNQSLNEGTTYKSEFVIDKNGHLVAKNEGFKKITELPEGSIFTAHYRFGGDSKYRVGSRGNQITIELINEDGQRKERAKVVTTPATVRHVIGNISAITIDSAPNEKYSWIAENVDHRYPDIADTLKKGLLFNPENTTPNYTRTASDKKVRAKKQAEVVTPLSIIKMMVNNLEVEKFSEYGNWKNYVRATSIEPACGETPFMVTRYDPETGKYLPINERVGILDRKLKKISNNAQGEKEWARWAMEAINSIFGFDIDGGSVLIARTNIVDTYADYLLDRWGRIPTNEELKELAEIVSHNYWQDDFRTAFEHAQTMERRKINRDFLKSVPEISNNDKTYNQIAPRRKADMDKALQSRRPDMNEKQRTDAISEIEKLGEATRQGGNPKVEKIATKWLLAGHIILPEDNYKILDAIKISEQQRFDPMQYDDPNEILAKYTIKPTKAELRINPDTVPEFKSKIDYRNGITIYSVSDTKKGQKAVRSIIDTHWGKDANPWCLAARQDGNLSQAWDMWKHYSGTKKYIAFKDGKLIAFSASFDDKMTWWDREDNPTNGIPFTKKINGNVISYVYHINTGETIKTYEDTKDGFRRKFYENGNVELEYDKNDPFKIRREFYENGQLKEDKRADGTEFSYYENGKLKHEFFPNGFSRSFYENGKLKIYQTPNLDGNGTITWYYKNGDIIMTRGLHKNGFPKVTEEDIKILQDIAFRELRGEDSYNQAMPSNNREEGIYNGFKLPFDPSELRTESGRSIEEAAKSELLLTPNGSPNLGRIPKAIGDNKEFPAGYIQSNAGAIQRSEAKHGNEIRGKNYDNAQTLLLDVLSNYSEIYQGDNNALILAVHGDNKHSAKSVIALIKKNGDGTYKVKDMGIARNRYFDNKKLLYSRRGPVDFGSDSEMAEPTEHLKRQSVSQSYARQSSNIDSLTGTNKPVNSNNNNFITDEEIESYNQPATHATGHIIQGNRFDLSKSGSGEGGAAFGYGAYLEQNPAVAETYRRYGLPNRGLGNVSVITSHGAAYDLFNDGGIKSTDNRHKYLGKSQREILNKIRDIVTEFQLSKKQAKLSEIKRLLYKPIRDDIKDLEATLKEGIEYVKTLDKTSKEYTDYQENIQKIQDVIKDLKSDLSYIRSIENIIVHPEKKGNIYKFDIPENYDLFMWDRTITEQPDKAKKVLNEAIDMLNNRPEEAIAFAFSKLTKNPQRAERAILSILNNLKRRYSGHFIDKYTIPTLQEYKSLKKIFADKNVLEDLFDVINRELLIGREQKLNANTATGESVYRKLTTVMRNTSLLSRSKNAWQKNASMWFNDHDIYGHKFLDAASRVKGEGTYNFVIWNSEKLKMLGLTEDSDEDAKEYFETTKRAQEQKNLDNEDNSYNQILGEKGAQKLDEDEGVTTRMDNLKIAKKLHEWQKTKKRIKMATGWELAPDGKWRYEIMDTGIDVDEILKRLGTHGQMTLQETWGDDNEVLKAYPELRDIKVVTMPFDKQHKAHFAFYSPSRKTIFIRSDLDSSFSDEFKTIFIHEVQHAIQRIEGFATGGNVKNFELAYKNYQRRVDRQVKKLSELDRKIGINSFLYKKFTWEELNDTSEEKRQERRKAIDEFRMSSPYANEYKKILDKGNAIDKEWAEKHKGAVTPRQIYARLGGEIEAFNVEKRRNMSEEERRTTPLADTQATDQWILPDKNGEYNQILGEVGARAFDKREGNNNRIDALNMAKEMTEAKVDAKTIKAVTGWELAPDGKWRYEIMDYDINKEKLREAMNKNDLPFIMDLADLYNNEELFNAYPYMRRYKVKFTKLENNIEAYYADDSHLIAINSNLKPSEIGSVLLHEIQHAIQDIEEFSRGGSSEEFSQDIISLKALKRQLKTWKDRRAKTLDESKKKDLDHKIAKIEARIEEVEENALDGMVEVDGNLYDDEYDAYRHLGGEIEARNVEARQNFTNKQRKNTLLSETQDYEDWLIRQNNFTDKEIEEYNQIAPRRKADMDKALQSRRPDMNKQQRANAISEIEKLGEQSKEGGDPKVEKLATKWLLSGHIILPEDNYKVLDAIRISEQEHFDPMKYNDPNEILAKYTIKPTKAELRINPDTVPEFSKSRHLKIKLDNEEHNIFIYTVKDTKKGQASVRNIIDTHWGKDANPWCLAARQDGNLSQAWDFWKGHYNKTDKRIAFIDGKLLAFSASDTEQVTWWDREDKPTNGIPYTAKYSGHVFDYIYNEELKKLIKVHEKLKNGTERRYYENGQLEFEHKPDGSEKLYYSNGQLKSKKTPDEQTFEYYKNGNLKAQFNKDGSGKEYYDNKQLMRELHRDGSEVSYARNGQKQREINSDGSWRYYNNGKVIRERLANGTNITYYENGNKKTEYTPDGSEYHYYENSKIQSEEHSDGRYTEYYENGNKRIEVGTDKIAREYDQNRKLLRTLTINSIYDVKPLPDIDLQLTDVDDKREPMVYNQAMPADTPELNVQEQLLEVRKQYQGTDKWLKAPNGKKTKLNIGQWLDFRTKNFKKFFGDWENDPENASKILDENGEPLVVYHGTSRADRIGDTFRADRATSGPMAYFTDNAPLASKYSIDKADTSLSRDAYDYRDQFTVEVKEGRGKPKPVNISNYWYNLTQEQKDKIAKIAPTIGRDDNYEIASIPNNEIGPGGYKLHIREARGNHLEALVREWLDSGNLFNKEREFLKILKLVGLDNVQYADPNAKYPGVFPVVLDIRKPFITTEISDTDLSALRKAAERAQKNYDPHDTYHSDAWDKTNIEPMEWLERLEDDVANDTTFAWTQIPDWVTKTLKKLGYDGIKDKGGKYHDTKHNVLIPFKSTQIKSAIANNGEYNNKKNTIYNQSVITREDVKQSFSEWLNSKSEEERKYLPISSTEPVRNAPVSFESKEIEQRYTGGQKDIENVNVLIRIMRSNLKLLKSFRSPLSKLSSKKDLLPAKAMLEQLGRKRGTQVHFAMKTFTENLKGLSNRQLDLFGRKRLLDDLMWRKQQLPSAELPFGFDEATLKKEHQRVTAFVEADPAVKKAIQLEERTIANIAREFAGLAKQLGLNLDNTFKNPHYYRHQILEYADTAKIGTRSKIQTETLQDIVDKELNSIKNRSFLKHYKGSNKDINTNYIQANAEVRQQMLMDIETMKTLLEIKKKYDIAPRLRNRIKTALKQGDAMTLSSLIPEGYTIFNPAGSRLIQSANSVTENIIAMALDDASEESGLPLNELLITIGRDDEEFAQSLWVVPTEIKDTLKEMARGRDRGILGNTARIITKGWKFWTLFNPLSNLKYNFRNFPGDLDAVIAGNPNALRYFGRSVRELTDFYRNGEATDDLIDFIECSGGLKIQSMQIHSLRSAELEGLDEEINSKGLRSLPAKSWKAIQRFFDNEVAFTEWRENLLRYAAYLAYKEDMDNHNGVPSTLGASNEDEIMAIPDIRERAYKMSNELLGDYENISEFGKILRELAMPFWSWQEINAKRYYRIIKNGISGNNASDFMVNILLAQTSKIPFYALTTAETFGKITLLIILAQVFNRLVFGDADDELPEEIKNKPHITFGKVDGRVYYFDRIGALSDLGEWINLDNIVTDAKQFANSQQTLGNYMKQVIKAPFNKAMNALNPFIKMPFEIATGKTLYPDAFNAGNIRDTGKYLASTLGLTWPYKAITGKPRNDLDELTNVLLYSVDADEAAYWQTLNKVRQFQKRVLGKYYEGFATTPRGEVLRNLKIALRYKDKAAIQRYLKEYKRLDGTDKGLKTSMRAMDPLHGLSKEEQKQFMKWISEEDRKYLNKANKYYRDLTRQFLN